MDKGRRPLALQRLAEEEMLFTLLGRAIHGKPDRELFASMADEQVFETVPFVKAGRAERARSHLQAWCSSCSRPFSDSDFERITVEYARLFVGARRVAAPLWESVYFNRERMVFQKQTFQVREAYRAYGLQADRFGHEPDDHLSNELLFVAKLAHEARRCVEHDDDSGTASVMGDLLEFLQNHLLAWVGTWSELTFEKATNDFYRGYALLVRASCEEAERSAKGEMA